MANEERLSIGDVWTHEETQEFREKLGKFRDGLPASQKKVFNRLLAGAAEGYRFGKNVGKFNRDATSFATTLGKFRDGLPPRQRDALSSIVAAGTVAWGAAAQGGQGDPESIYMWHALLTPLAIIVVGVVLIARELSKGDADEAPDLSNIPTDPESPGGHVY